MVAFGGHSLYSSLETERGQNQAARVIETEIETWKEKQTVEEKRGREKEWLTVGIWLKDVLVEYEAAGVSTEMKSTSSTPSELKVLLWQLIGLIFIVNHFCCIGFSNGLCGNYSFWCYIIGQMNIHSSSYHTLSILSFTTTKIIKLNIFITWNKINMNWNKIKSKIFF